MFDSENDQTVYSVVLKDEEQYSIWPADRDEPPGWREAGRSGTKAECLAYIKEVWTDMRPLSLRKRMVASPSLAFPPATPEGYSRSRLYFRAPRM